MAVGKKIADFELRRVEDGAPFKLKSIVPKKTPTVVCFISLNDADSAAAVNKIQEDIFAHQGDRIEFVVVHVGDSIADAKEFKTEQALTAPHFCVLKDPPAAYNVTHFPHFLVVGAKGRVTMSTSDPGVDYLAAALS